MTTPETTAEPLDGLLDRLKKLRPVFESDPRILAVFLFGSHVDGHAMPWSDIDLAVLYDDQVHWREHLGLDAQVCEILGADGVDWLNLRELPLPLQYRVIQGLVIYERESAQVSDFIAHTLVRYYDLRHVLDIYDREFDTSLVHDYGIRPTDSSDAH